jgi:hypothetical protein
MRYCIGCEHFYYEPGREGHVYSSYTQDSGTPPSASCRKGLWSANLDEDFTQEKFQTAMEQAETCEEYSEREAP